MKKLIQNSFNKMKSRNWNIMYIAVDIHDTIFPANYSSEIVNDYYPFALKTLQHLSNRKDVVLILYTSTQPEYISKYLTLFKNDNIVFKYVNCNPEVSNSEIANFDDKFYFNILIDDKAGFDAQHQWAEIYSEFLMHPE